MKASNIYQEANSKINQLMNIKPSNKRNTMKTYKITQQDGQIVSEGYGTLQGAKLDAKDLQEYFTDRLQIWDENGNLYY